MQDADDRHAEHGNGFVIWIGRRIWPYPRILLEDRCGIAREGGVLEFPGRERRTRRATSSPPSKSSGRPDADITHEITHDITRAEPRGRDLLARSLFIDPPDDAARLWAIDLALRCPAVTAVIADGSRLGMAETRRLQLAAESGRALALLARPPDELAELSAAATRWRVAPVPSAAGRPRWSIELLRCKGAQGCALIAADGAGAGAGASRESDASSPAPAQSASSSSSSSSTHHPQVNRMHRLPGAEFRAGMRHWLLEWDHAQGVVTVPADVVDRPAAPASPERGGIEPRGADRAHGAGRARRRRIA